MNREQKRNFVKNAKKKGMSKTEAEKFLKVADTTGNTYNPAKTVNTGDKVTLRIDDLKARKNWGIMNPAYKEFVEKSEGVVYTAVRERAELLHLEEEPKWLFWCGDLDVVEPTSNESGEDVAEVDE